MSIADWDIKRVNGKTVLLHACKDSLGRPILVSCRENWMGDWKCDYCGSAAPIEIIEAAILCKCTRQNDTWPTTLQESHPDRWVRKSK